MLNCCTDLKQGTEHAGLINDPRSEESPTNMHKTPVSQLLLIPGFDQTHDLLSTEHLLHLTNG